VTVSGSGIGWAIMHVAADRQPLQQPTTQFLQAGCPMPFLLPGQQRQSTEGLLEDVRF